MIQGAIFDADGTLLDSMGMWDTVGERYLASLGVTARPGLRQILFPLSLSQCAAYLRESYGLSLSVDAIEAQDRRKGVFAGPPGEGNPRCFGHCHRPGGDDGGAPADRPAAVVGCSVHLW